MLKKEERLTITGHSMIGETEACGFQAQIDSTNPSNMTFSSWQTNPSLYKENREVCRTDQAEFEDYCFNLQDEKLAELAETSEKAEA